MRTAARELQDQATRTQPLIAARLRRRDLTVRERARLEMAKAVSVGEDQARLAAWSGRSVRTVHRWLAGFRRGVFLLEGRGEALKCRSENRLFSRSSLLDSHSFGFAHER